MKKNLKAPAVVQLLLIYAFAASQTYSQESGEALYHSNCAVCHRPQGEGIDNIFPALRNNAYVMGDVEVLITTVLNGRGGMPSFSYDVSDQELSKILQYVRKSFANKSDLISPAMIAAVKKSISEKIVSDHDVQ